MDLLRKSRAKETIAELARQGFHYVSPWVSGYGGGGGLQMELCGSACGGLMEYRFFDVNEPDELERDLNALGRDGFHVVPRSLDASLHLAERSQVHTQSYAYRVFEASGENAIEQTLNARDSEGFAPLGIAAHVGWTVHVYLVMEKATTAAAE